MSKKLSALLLCHRNYLNKKLLHRKGGSDDILSIFNDKYPKDHSED